MEFAHVVAGRRMVRAYRPDPIAEETIETVIASGLSAPTAGNSRGVSVVVVTAAQKRSEIATAAGEDDFAVRGFPRWLSTAPVHIVPCVSPEKYRSRYAAPDKTETDPDEWAVPYWWVDAGATMMGILLAAVDEGLAASFLGEHAIPGLDALLEAPEGTIPIGVVTLGHPAPEEDRSSHSLGRDTTTRRVHREKWTDS